MIREKYDIVIVGFGIAGSIAAKVAAENNASVLILESKSKIGDNTKKSFQGIRNLLTNEDILEYFKKMNINIKPLSMYNCCKVHLQPDISAKIVLNKPIGYLLKRGNEENSIDNQLAKQAMKNDVDVSLNSRFIKFDGREKIVFRYNKNIKSVKAKIIIGADGLYSRVAKLSGLANEPLESAIGFGYHYTDLDDVDPGTVEGFIGHNIAPGEYAYIVPDKDEATVVTTLRPKMMRHGMSIKEYYDNFIKLPMVKKKLRLSKRLNIVSGTVAIKPLKNSVKANILLAGDAARLTDPLLGFGIKNAILSGKLAAESAAGIINDGKSIGKKMDKDLRIYDKKLKAMLFSDLKKRFIFRKVYETINDRELGELIQLLKELDANLDLNRMFETKETTSIKIKALKILKNPHKIKLLLKYLLPAFRANYSFRS